MGIFFVLLLVPVLIQHIAVRGYNTDYRKKNSFALFIFFLLLTLMVMLRHPTVGTDTANYIHFFDKYTITEWSDIAGIPLEIGYSVLNKLITVFTDDPQVLLAVSGLLVSIMIYPTYRRLCTDTSLTIVLFCTLSTFLMMFSGIRQMLAIGIGFIAYEFTRKKKLIPFIITVCTAVLFHTSAFMLAFMYPLFHARITKKWLYAIVPVLTAVFIFNKPIFRVLALIVERYTDYSIDISATGAYTMLILFAVFTVFAFIIPDEARMDSEDVGLRNLLLLALTIQIFAPLHSLSMRMNYYYIIFIPLLIPRIIELRREKYKEVAVVGRNIMLGFFLLYFFVNAYTGSNLGVFPYSFFWEGM